MHLEAFGGWFEGACQGMPDVSSNIQSLNASRSFGGMFEGVLFKGCLQQCLESACILKLWGDGLRVHVYGMSAAILRF